VEGDGVYILANVTAIMDTGWYWSNPRLSAPYTLDLRAFPANFSVDYALVWLVTRFTNSPGLAINLTWLLMAVLSGATALYCMEKLGAHPMVALAFSTLYAVMPFGFYRSTHHLMSFYLVPLGCTLALLLATAEVDALGARFRWLLTAGCVLMGFNNIYNAYFCGFLVAVGTLIGFGRTGNRRVLKVGTLSLCLLSVAAVVNLAPSLYSWRANGKPYTEFKTVADSEIFGLKIRHLLSPQTPHGLPPLAAWLVKEREANFPIENENSTARLGVVGSAGFLLLLGALMVSDRLSASPSGRFIVGLARLNLAALLLATVGGFGSLISLFLLEQIRGYNRIVVFIAFFALVALALATTRAMEIVRRNHRAFVALCLGIMTTALFGVYDQQYAATNLRLRAASDQQKAGVLQDVVMRTEKVLKPGSLLYEMPDTPFPPDGIRHGMQPYDQGRPHIYSATLRWSWPDFSLLRHAWAAAVPDATTDGLIPYLCRSGFDAVWLDRAGYATPQSSPEGDLRRRCGAPLVASTDGRYLVFDLRSIREANLQQAAPAEIARQQASVLAPVLSQWGTGFYPLERNTSNGQVFRWSRATSDLTLVNASDREKHLTLRCLVQAGHAELADLVIHGPGVDQKMQVNAVARELSVPIRLSPKQRAVLKFEFRGKPLVVQGDSRSLCFIVIEPRLVE
jgi:phosphoglycerol transferase